MRVGVNVFLERLTHAPIWRAQMKKTMKFLRLLSCLLALIVPFTASGQTSTAITGRVTDQTGAVIPKATVIAHNESTNQDIKTVSTSTGDFTFTDIRRASMTCRRPHPDSIPHRDWGDPALGRGSHGKIDLEAGSGQRERDRARW